MCALLQVKADAYEKIDKELLGYVEDVLLNRRADSTERMLDFAAKLDPKSPPTAVKRLGGGQEGPESNVPPRLNPIPDDANPLAVTELPTVPEYKAWRYDHVDFSSESDE